jgi:hypothetical protein
MVDSICDTCDAGQELSVVPAVPCQMCDDFSFGTTGICETCSSGQQPNAQRTACFDCPAGYAGMNGACTNCPPGRAPDPLQTSCELCLPGTYRDAEEVNSCVECPLGMTSFGESVHVDACRCPEGRYDHKDAAGKWSSIWCWPEGVTANRQYDIIFENALSIGEAEATDIFGNPSRRCVVCPACLDCGDTIDSEAVPYLGRPFIREGWTMYDLDLPPQLDEGESSLSTTLRTRRDVFRCPFDETACTSEFSGINTTGLRAVESDTLSQCQDGYTSHLCSTCQKGFAIGEHLSCQSILKC